MTNAPNIVPKTIKLEKPKARNSRNNSGERRPFSFLLVTVVILMKTWKLAVLSQLRKSHVFKNHIKREHSIKCLSSSNKEYYTSPKTSNGDQGF